MTHSIPLTESTEEGVYHLLSQVVLLLIQYTNSDEVDWTQYRVIKGEDWRIYCDVDCNWILETDDSNMLMYVKLKL